jgi:hypothetical protein
MTPKAVNFRTPDEMVKFLVTNAIPQAQIVSVFVKDGGVWLVYYS